MDCLCNTSCDIYDDSGENLSFFHETFRKARKDHICCECKRVIKKGEKYEYITACWECIGVENYKTCLGCARLRKDTCAAVGFLKEEIIKTCGADLL